MSALVLHYTFEPFTVSGDVVVNASIGAAIANATLSPAMTLSTTVYRVGTQSLACNNVAAGLLVPPLTTASASVTVALWFRATAAAAATLVSLSSSSNQTQTYTLQLTSSRLFSLTDNTVTTTTTAAYVVGRWHHVAWTLQEGTWQLFLDGVCVHTVTPASTSMPTQFDANVVGQSFAGYLDDVRVYHTVLSADQVYDLFHRATCQHYYRFEPDDISGNTVLNYASPHALAYDCSLAITGTGTNPFQTSSTTVACGEGALCYTPASISATHHVALPPLVNHDPSGSTLALWCYTSDTMVNGPMTLCALTSSTACYRCTYDSCYNALVFARTDASAQGFATTQLVAGRAATTVRTTSSTLWPYNPVTPGAWHFVVWTIAPTFWKVWIDGIATTLDASATCVALDGYTTIPMSSLLTSLPAVFAGPNTLLYAASQQPFNGYLDDVRYMNRVVSDDDVRWLYTTGCVRTNYYDASGNDFLHLYASSSSSSSSSSFVPAANTGHRLESGKDIGATFGVSPGASAVRPPPTNTNYLYNGTAVSSYFASVEPVLPFVATGTHTVIDYGTGQYTVVFTDYGTLQVGNTIASVDVACVGGGGGGGSSSAAMFGGGGGAGGAVVTGSVTVSPYTSYVCHVGQGGAAGASGSATSFRTVSAAGGGAGGSASSSAAGTGSTSGGGDGGDGSVAGSAGVAVA